MRLWAYLRGQMAAHPHQTIGEGENTIHFHEMIACAEQMANSLSGVRCCAILCDSEFMAAKGLLACFAAGVTAVPLSKRYGEAHCQKIINKVSPDAIITDNAGRLCVKRRPHAQYTVPAVHPALILCTSGTTGSPKGAMLTEKNIVTNVSDITDYFAIDEQDTILIARPLYHGAVLMGEFLSALVNGVHIRFYSGVFNPSAMPGLIRRYGVSVICGTPTLFSLMVRFMRGESALPLRSIAVSGECMSKETGLSLAKTFKHVNIYHVYGLTEAGPRVSYLPPALFQGNPASVGRPLRSTTLKIIKENGGMAAAGEEGILYVKGASVMAGYYNEPDKTSAVLQNGWLCTGDRAFIDAAGLLTIKGRNDDLIIKAGMNIYPQEIEGALKQDSRVREVLAYGYETATGTQIGLKAAGDFVSLAEVKRLCAEILPPYQMPMKIELVTKLEKNGSGKLKRGGKLI